MKDSSRQTHVWAGSLLRLREDSFSLPLIFGISSTVPDMEWVLSKCLENKWLHWWVNKIIHPFTLIHKVNKEFIYYIHLMVTQDRLTEVWVIWTYIRLQTLQPSDPYPWIQASRESGEISNGLRKCPAEIQGKGGDHHWMLPFFSNVSLIDSQSVKGCCWEVRSRCSPRVTICDLRKGAWLRGDGGEASQHVLCTLVALCTISPCSPAKLGSSTPWSGPVVRNAREPALPVGRRGQPTRTCGPPGRGPSICRAGAGELGQRKERGHRTHLHPPHPYPLLSFLPLGREPLLW